MGKLHAFKRQVGPAVILVMAGLVLWESFVWLGQIDPWFLPGPIDILREGSAMFPRLMEHTWATLKITLFGFAAAVSAGMTTAALVHWSSGRLPWISDAMTPLLVLSQNIPIIVLAPLLLVWFGFGLLPKILVIVLVCFFPITVTMLAGLAETDRGMMNYMKMSGAGKSQIFFKLELPYALPFLFSGLKISATYSVMAAVISEWLGAKEGLGILMQLAKSSFRTDRLFVSILMVVAMSLLLYSLITVVERKWIRWKPDPRGPMK